MKIDSETIQAEEKIKTMLDDDTNAGGSGPDIPWDSQLVQIIIQTATEHIIAKRIKLIVENKLP